MIRFCTIVAILFVCASCAFADPATTQPQRIATTQTVSDLRGVSISPLHIAAGRRAVLLVFISADCPISNGYAPAIAEICQAYMPRGIDCYTVYTDASLTAANAQSHHDQYSFPCDALLDPEKQLAHLVGATRTPEAVIVGADGVLLYRGRIDDQYVTVGRKRFAATTHELRDALGAVVTGQAVNLPWMPAVGCGMN